MWQHFTNLKRKTTTTKESFWHLLLMTLFLLHQLLLVLHVHGGHDNSLIGQHLPQVLYGPFLLFDFTLQLGISSFSHHQLHRGAKARSFGNTRDSFRIMEPQMHMKTLFFFYFLTSAIRSLRAHFASTMLVIPSTRCLRRPSLSATRTFCWRSAICAFLEQTVQSSAQNRWAAERFLSSPTQVMEAQLLLLSPEANFGLQVLHLFVQGRLQSPLVLQFRNDQSPALQRHRQRHDQFI